MKNKEILVTGGCGFIGSHLVEKLVNENVNVKAFVQYNSFNQIGWLSDLDEKIQSTYRFDIVWEDTGITKDDNDYFHLTIDRNSWQTLYRVRGIVKKNDRPEPFMKFYWESNLYWVSGIDGIEVPTSNTTSVSGSDGEVSNMIAPVQIMAGDTLILNYVYFDWIYESDTYSGEMRFVLE